MKRIPAVLLVLLFGALLAACSSGGNSPSAVTRDPVLFEGPPPDKSEYLMELVFLNTEQMPDALQTFEVSIEAQHREDVAIEFPSWCSANEAALKNNLSHLKYLVAVDGDSYDVTADFGWDMFEAPSRYCANPKGYLLFDEPGKHQVTFTIRIDANINDGWEDYQSGDRVFKLNLDVQ
jgi:hypothetical protein